MSMDKPYRIEVTVDAARDVIWSALTEPEQIRHWFGWDYDGLEEEIEWIFVKEARRHPPDRIEFDSDVTLHDLGDGRTLIRAVKPGDLDAAEWQDVYGDIEEGWITFFNQLKYWLEHHPRSRRRMIVRKAQSFPPLVGEPWHESRFQRGVVTPDDELAIVFGKPGAEQMLLVTTYDLSDDDFAGAERRWDQWAAQLTPTDRTRP
jgi:uncharacterized protein YndB with AHSA1/START domain